MCNFVKVQRMRDITTDLVKYFGVTDKGATLELTYVEFMSAAPEEGEPVISKYLPKVVETWEV